MDHMSRKPKAEVKSMASHGETEKVCDRRCFMEWTIQQASKATKHD